MSLRIDLKNTLTTYQSRGEISMVESEKKLLNSHREKSTGASSNKQSLTKLLKRHQSPVKFSKSPLALSSRVSLERPSKSASKKYFTNPALRYQNENICTVELLSESMEENCRPYGTTTPSFTLRTPFQTFLDQRGFGPKSSPKMDPHTVALDKSLDKAIVRVATHLKNKEDRSKDNYALRIQKTQIIDDCLQLTKENTRLCEQIAKEEVRARDRENQNLQVKKQIANFRKKIQYYQKVKERLDQEEQEKELLREKTEERIAKLSAEIARDCQTMEVQEELIRKLSKKFQEVEMEAEGWRRRKEHARRLEDERIRIVREKEKVLQSVVDEVTLTVRYGDKVNRSPIGKKVRKLVSGSKK